MYGAKILHSGKLLPISQEDLMESIYTAGQKKNYYAEGVGGDGDVYAGGLARGI